MNLSSAACHEMPLKPFPLLRPAFSALSKRCRRTLAGTPPMASISPAVPTEEGSRAIEQSAPRPLQVAKRLEKFKTTIFTQMSMLAVKHGAINLGQGFPNFDGPEFVKAAAIQAIKDGKNQYARGYGVPDLNSAIAARFKNDSGLDVDPEKEITVTSGCTEAIAATILGLINPGDEVILFAPFYDSYEATLSMAGAKIKSVTLRPPNFSVPLDELKSAFSKDTRAILINTPHNPTGKMFERSELEFIATLCIENDVLAFTDEVYDKLAFEAEHISLASLPGMYERTVTMNSLGKTFSLTGWKIGWAIAPVHLTWGLRQAHSYLTFATSTPMQYAASVALRTPDSYYDELKRDYMAKKAILVEGLKDAGFVVYPSSGTYFVVVDHTPFGFENDVAFCEYLIREVGVVAIPTSVFYLNPEDGKNLVRFTFCKDEATLRAAVERMKVKLGKSLKLLCNLRRQVLCHLQCPQLPLQSLQTCANPTLTLIQTSATLRYDELSPDLELHRLRMSQIHSDSRSAWFHGPASPQRSKSAIVLCPLAVSSCDRHTRGRTGVSGLRLCLRF